MKVDLQALQNKVAALHVYDVTVDGASACNRRYVMLQDVSGCQKAASQIFYTYQMSVTQEGNPSGCFVEKERGFVWFNTHPNGRGNTHSAMICVEEVRKYQI